METSEQFLQSYCLRLDDPLQFRRLFDCLPELYFWAKDEESRFVAVSRTVMALAGADSAEEMIGRTDLEFYPRNLAEHYIEEDRQVMRTRKPLLNQAWLVPNYRGELKWFICSKVPLFDRAGRVVGTAGVMRDFETAGAVVQPYQEMKEVVDYVLANHSERIEVADLAAVAHLSVSQFDRKFKRVFQITPQQFILRVRIHAASQALASTDQSVLKIALAAGFYDQSYFTKQFHLQMGMTPSAYRRKYRSSAGKEFNTETRREGGREELGVRR